MSTPTVPRWAKGLPWPPMVEEFGVLTTGSWMIGVVEGAEELEMADGDMVEAAAADEAEAADKVVMDIVPAEGARDDVDTGAVSKTSGSWYALGGQLCTLTYFVRARLVIQPPSISIIEGV